jgi:hypothetical protein
MLIDTSNQQELARLDEYIAKAKANGDLIEVTTRASRSLKQNAYLHVLIAYFSAQMSVTKEYTKRVYLKQHVCRDIFLISRYDALLLRNANIYRSTSSLTKEEMTLVIERFRDWSAQNAGLYLPSADEYKENKELRKQMLKDIENAKRYI